MFLGHGTLSRDALKVRYTCRLHCVACIFLCALCLWLDVVKLFIVLSVSKSCKKFSSRKPARSCCVRIASSERLLHYK